MLDLDSPYSLAIEARDRFGTCRRSLAGLDDDLSIGSSTIFRTALPAAAISGAGR